MYIHPRTPTCPTCWEPLAFQPSDDTDSGNVFHGATEYCSQECLIKDLGMTCGHCGEITVDPQQGFCFDCVRTCSWCTRSMQWEHYCVDRELYENGDVQFMPTCRECAEMSIANGDSGTGSEWTFMPAVSAEVAA